jgi:hypothetical protein
VLFHASPPAASAVASSSAPTAHVRSRNDEHAALALVGSITAPGSDDPLLAVVS